MLRRLVALFLLVAACGGADDAGNAAGESDTSAGTPASTTPQAASPAEGTSPAQSTAPSAGESDECAHVIGGEIVWQGETATVSATVLSADTGWEKYADAWEVRTPDGEVLGVRELAHPHETEQPFTRSLGDVTIPADVTEVVLAARDSVVGFCGDMLTVAVPDRS